MRSQNKKLIINSGGQTGVDRAALDFALGNGLPCIGWCPAGRLAEDGFILTRYPLQETLSPDPVIRTEMNVIDSDGTMIIIYHDMDAGTLMTQEMTYEHHKPIFVWIIGRNHNVQQFKHWLTKHNIRKLNVAGPRESYAPGIYEEALELLTYLFAEYVH